jgi:hypothetical protein
MAEPESAESAPKRYREQKEWVDRTVKRFKTDRVPAIHNILTQCITNKAAHVQLDKNLLQVVSMACETLPEADFKTFQANVESFKPIQFEAFDSGDTRNCVWVGPLTFGCSVAENVFFFCQDKDDRKELTTLDELKCETLDQLERRRDLHHTSDFSTGGLMGSMNEVHDWISDWAENANYFGICALGWDAELNHVRKFMKQAACTCT